MIPVKLAYLEKVLCQYLESFPGRLSWLVYIIGSVIGGRVSFASTDEHDAMDGELVCRSVVVIVWHDIGVQLHIQLPARHSSLHTCHELWPENCEIRQILKGYLITFCEIFTKITLELPQNSQKP